MPASELPPIHSGGPPARAGPGRSATPSTRSPRQVKSAAPDHRRRQTAIASSVRAPRSRNGTPSARNSNSIHPDAMPQITRPPESASRLASDRASATGWR